MTPSRSPKPKPFFERVTGWIGSPVSLGIHTTWFVLSFVLSVTKVVPWDRMLLVLTTVVSLEAIYLSIFIQMTVNHQTKELAELSEDVDEIQEDIEEISEDEDRELAAEAAHHAHQNVTLEQLTKDLKRVLDDVAALKEQRSK